MSFDIGITVVERNPGELERRLQGVPLGLARGLAVATTRLHHEAHQNVLGRVVQFRNTQRWRQAGLPTLAASLQKQVVVTKRQITGRVWSDIFYGRLLEDGVRAHAIKARTRRRKPRPLAIGTATGSPIFRMSAQHPGIRERRWMGKALEATQREIANDIGRAVEDETDRG